MLKFGRRTALLPEPDREELPRVVPFVKGGVRVESLVALEPDEFGTRGCGEDLGDLRLPAAGLALHEDRLLQFGGEEDRGREGALGDVVLPLHRGEHGIDGIPDDGGHGAASGRYAPMNQGLDINLCGARAQVGAHQDPPARTGSPQAGLNRNSRFTNSQWRLPM